MKRNILPLVFLVSLLFCSGLQLPCSVVGAVDLEAVNDSYYLGTDGYFVIDGEVVNNANFPYEDVKITVTYYNSNNNVIGTANTYDYLEILIPQQTSPFSLSSYPQKNLGVHHYELAVTGTKSIYSPYRDLETQDVTYDFVNDYFVLYGDVYNFGDYTATEVEVIVTYYDSEGYVLGSSHAYTDPDTIDSDDFASFEISSDPYIIEPDSYRLQIQCDEVAYLSTISCNVLQSQVALGGTQTVTGSITPVTSNADVLLTYTKPNSNKITKTVKSSSQGNYQDTITPDAIGTWKVKASWGGTSTFLGSESEEIFFTVSSKQSTTITLSLNITSATMEGTIAVSGTISPKVTGKTVTLYFTKPDSSQATLTTTTDSNGNYIANVYNFNQVGTWSVRAGWEGDTTYTGSTSSTRTFVISQVYVTKIKIIIKDASNNLLSGVTVSSTSQPTGQATLNGVTSSDGSYTFSSVKDGSYTFTISKNGYKSKSESLTTTLGVTTEKTISLEAESSGIPGYPYESILLGVIACIAIYTVKKEQLFYIH